jgi:signal transduction histidine kinase
MRSKRRPVAHEESEPRRRGAAGNRRGRAVSGWLGLLTWALAASVLHMRGRRRLVRAARAHHEVRGPLCTAQLALDGLERSARVEAIGLELRRAALALDDLAGLRRHGAVERLDLGRLLADATPAWQALADARGVTLTVEPSPAPAVGDPLRLAQACSNIVANAIEHGGGDVRVSSSIVAGCPRIEVADLGAGLPAPLPALVAAARGRRSSRGHGLAIAAAIAERHRGRLAAIPAPTGAHLVLELPAAGTARPARRRPRSSPFILAPRRRRARQP